MHKNQLATQAQRTHVPASPETEEAWMQRFEEARGANEALHARIMERFVPWALSNTGVVVRAHTLIDDTSRFESRRQHEQGAGRILVNDSPLIRLSGEDTDSRQAFGKIERLFGTTKVGKLSLFAYRFSAFVLNEREATQSLADPAGHIDRPEERLLSREETYFTRSNPVLIAGDEVTPSPNNDEILELAEAHYSSFALTDPETRNHDELRSAYLAFRDGRTPAPLLGGIKGALRQRKLDKNHQDNQNALNEALRGIATIVQNLGNTIDLFESSAQDPKLNPLLAAELRSRKTPPPLYDSGI